MSSRMKFAVVGLGQCGGNIANTFARYGYPSIAINTSILDLKDLSNIPENRKIHIPFTDSDGAGKDPRIGEKAIEMHLTNILSGLQEFAQGADAILLTAGLGGGTGSNIALLGNLLKKLNLPIVVLATIPTNNESALAKINALRSINKLVSENFNSFVLIDNGKILSLFPESSLAAFYPQANEFVVRTFANFNSLSTELSSRCLISFDNEDFRKVLLSHGILIFGETELPPGEINTLDDILPNLKTIWETSGLMAEGFDFKSAACGAVSIFAPASVLQKTSSRFLNMLGDEFKSLTDGATCYFGLYELQDSSAIKISSMLGRLAIPDRLQGLLTEASSEGENLNRKIRKELPQLDISSLDTMDLFAPSPALISIPATRFASTPASSSPTDTHVLRKDGGAYSPSSPQPFSDDNGEPDSESDPESKSYSLEEYVRMKKTKTT